MIAQPKLKFPLWHEQDPSEKQEVRTFPSALADGLFIDCEIVAPKSSEGRSVTLWITPERADAMMLALREYNIQRRR